MNCNDLEFVSANRNGVSDATTNQRLRERRYVGNEALARFGFVFANDEITTLVALVIEHRDLGSETNGLGVLGRWHQLGAPQPLRPIAKLALEARKLGAIVSRPGIACRESKLAQLVFDLRESACRDEIPMRADDTLRKLIELLAIGLLCECATHRLDVSGSS